MTGLFSKPPWFQLVPASWFQVFIASQQLRPFFIYLTFVSCPLPSYLSGSTLSFLSGGRGKALHFESGNVILQYFD